MSSKKKPESTKKVENELFYSDIIEVEFIDENGNLKKKKTYMNHEKFVKEEIVNV